WRKNCAATTARPKPSRRRTCGAVRCRPTSQRANTGSRCAPSMPGRANSARARPIGCSRYRSHHVATELPDDLPVKPFRTAAAWEKWLAAHRDARGIWLKIAKKDSGIASVTYAAALDVALCHGWIDGQKRGCDAQYFLQRFTPRRPKGVWSKINIGHAERLVAAGRMQPAGLREIEAAKADGRWDAAYEEPHEWRFPASWRRHWRAAARRKPSSTRSTAPTATPSAGGCRPQRSRRRGLRARRSSSRCWRAAKS